MQHLAFSIASVLMIIVFCLAIRVTVENIRTLTRGSTLDKMKFLNCGVNRTIPGMVFNKLVDKKLKTEKITLCFEVFVLMITVILICIKIFEIVFHVQIK